MTDEQREEYGNLYDILMEKPLRIFEIFSDYFGEKRVDIQGFRSKENFCESKAIRKNDLQALYGDNYIEEEENRQMFILVWFPEVKVTNEHDKFVIIQDLYAKVRIDTQGQMIGKFLLNRATYPVTHIKSNYMH